MNFQENFIIINCSEQNVFYDKPPDYCIDENMKLTWTNIITIMIYSVIFFLSLYLNSKLFKMTREAHQKDGSRVHKFIMHLNIADLIVTLITIPIEVGWKWSIDWNAGNTACKLFTFMRPIGIYLSSFLVISLSIDR
jgi:gonadotropin-releasing hormone receptor